MGTWWATALVLFERREKKSALPAKNQTQDHPVHNLVPTQINPLVPKLNAWLNGRVPLFK